MLKPVTGNYKKAFQCKKCPQRGDEQGCPMWWNIPVEDEHNPNIVENMEGCGYALMPFVLKSVIKAGYTGAEEISKMRSDVVDRVTEVSGKFLLMQKEKLKQLEQINEEE